MNRLTLAQRLQTECGVSGTLSTTIGQTGSLGRLVTWNDVAWEEIQTKHNNWEFMRSSVLRGGGVSFATVNGTATYPLGTGAGYVGVLAANFGKWDLTTFRNMVTTVGVNSEIHMSDILYDEWRNGYMYGAMQSVRTRPIAIAQAPDKALCLGPVPNGDYTITGDYFTAPTAMSLDADTPTGLPAEHHMAIVYKAMEYYALYESAQEVMTRATSGYARILSRMESLYLPQIQTAGALA